MFMVSMSSVVVTAKTPVAYYSRKQIANKFLAMGFKAAFWDCPFQKLSNLQTSQVDLYIELFKNIRTVLDTEQILKLTLPSSKQLSAMATNGGIKALKNPAFAQKIASQYIDVVKGEVDLTYLPNVFFSDLKGRYGH